MLKYLINWKYYAYRIYADLYSRFHQHEWRNNKIPLVQCQICGGYHVERLCPNAKRMGFLDPNIDYGKHEDGKKNLSRDV
jgi:hypothetical protein